MRNGVHARCNPAFTLIETLVVIGIIEARSYTLTNDCDKDDAMWKCLSWGGGPWGWNAHHAGNNVLFGDGHVDSRKSFDPQIMTYDPQKRGVAWEALVGE